MLHALFLKLQARENERKLRKKQRELYFRKKLFKYLDEIAETMKRR